MPKPTTKRPAIQKINATSAEKFLQIERRNLRDVRKTLTEERKAARLLLQKSYEWEARARKAEASVASLPAIEADLKEIREKLGAIQPAVQGAAMEDLREKLGNLMLWAETGTLLRAGENTTIAEEAHRAMGLIGFSRLIDFRKEDKAKGLSIFECVKRLLEIIGSLERGLMEERARCVEIARRVGIAPEDEDEKLTPEGVAEAIASEIEAGPTPMRTAASHFAPPSEAPDGFSPTREGWVERVGMWQRRAELAETELAKLRPVPKVVTDVSIRVAQGTPIQDVVAALNAIPPPRVPFTDDGTAALRQAVTEELEAHGAVKGSVSVEKANAPAPSKLSEIVSVEITPIPSVVPRRAEVDVHGAGTVSIVTPSGEQLQTQILPEAEGPRLELIVNDPRGSRDQETGISSGSVRLDRDAARKLFVAVADFAGFPEALLRRWDAMGARERMNVLSRFAFGDGGMEENPAGWSIVEQLQQIAGKLQELECCQICAGKHTAAECTGDPALVGQPMDWSAKLRETRELILKLIRLAWTIDQGEDDSTLAVMVAADEWVKAMSSATVQEDHVRQLVDAVTAWRKVMESAPLVYKRPGQDLGDSPDARSIAAALLKQGETAGIIVPGSGEVLPDGSFKAMLRGHIGSLKVSGILAEDDPERDDGRAVITLELLPKDDGSEISVIAHMDGAQSIGGSYMYQDDERRKGLLLEIVEKITSEEGAAGGWRLP